jgi:hypothetical protein
MELWTSANQSVVFLTSSSRDSFTIATVFVPLRTFDDKGEEVETPRFWGNPGAQ